MDTNSPSERYNHLLEERDQLAQKCVQLVEELDEIRQKYEQLVEEKENLYQSYNHLSSELLEIKNSRTWMTLVLLKQHTIYNKIGKILFNLINLINKADIFQYLLASPLSKTNQLLKEKLSDQENEELKYTYQFPKPIVLHRYQQGTPISVVIICYNKAKELPYVISALAKNTLRPDLVVLCDDGSIDDSVKVFIDSCESQELNYIFLQEIPKKNSFRLNTLRNKGVSICLDGLVIILDADHVPSRTHIEAHVNLHLSNPSPVLSTGPRLEYANPDCSGAVNFLWGHESISMIQPSIDKPIPSWTGVLASNMGMCKQGILDLGGFDPIYDGNYGFDDIDFTYRAWLAGYFFAGCFEAYVIHIPHPRAKVRLKNNINQQKFKSKYNFTPKYPKEVDRITRAAWHDYLHYLYQQNH